MAKKKQPTQRPRWKDGFRNVPADVPPEIAFNEISKAINQAKTESNRDKAKVLVQNSRRKSSPLHRYFEWDNKAAADNWRIHQAEYLIRAVELVWVEEDDDNAAEVATRAFVNVPPGENDDEDSPVGYQNIIEAMSDEERRQRIIAQALKDLEQWRVRYAHLVEVGEIIAATKKVERKLRRKAKSPALASR